METPPFLDETKTLFRSVSTHDFDTLAALCDDDFGIVDIDPKGGSVVIETRAEWEDWFHSLFDQLDAMDAETTTDILDYKALRRGELGYSVVDFRQNLTMGDTTAHFYCVATIIWKQTPDGWKESRWHCSVIRVEPNGLPGLEHFEDEAPAAA
jgi:ketosteroid isomerase-like protein